MASPRPAGFHAKNLPVDGTPHPRKEDELALPDDTGKHELALHTINDLLDFDAVENPLTKTLEFIARIFDCAAASIWQFHDNRPLGDRAYLTLEAVTGHSSTEYLYNCIPEGNGIVWLCLKPGSPKWTYIDKVDQTLLVNKNLANIYSSGILLLRIQVNDKLFGVACFNQPKKHTPESIASISKTIENVAALEIRTRENWLNAHTLEQIINSALLPKGTLRQLCATAAANVRELLNCQAASVFLRRALNPTSTLLDLVAVSYDPAFAPSVETAKFQNGEPISYELRVQSLTGTVFNTGKCILCNQVSLRKDNSRFYREIKDTSNDSWLGVPIFNPFGHCIGVIRCTGKQSGQGSQRSRYIFSSQDVRLLQYYASILSATIASLEVVKRLEQVNSQLELAEKLREHEMTGPLATISANAHFVRRYLTEPAAKSKDRRLAEIIADAQMCSFFLHESTIPLKEEVDRNRQYASLEEVVTRLGDFLRREIAARSHLQSRLTPEALDYEFFITPMMKVETMGSSPRTLVNVRLMQRAFYNIAVNAIKYGHTGGYLRIHIHGDPIQDLTYVDFEDDGIGILQDDIPRIFDEGVRGANLNHAQYPGSGLGLYVAKRIVELHGGSIQVVSRKDPTKIQVTLPVTSPEDSAERKAASDNLIRSDKPLKIKL